MTQIADLSPVEFNVVVRLDPVEEKTLGGIILPGEKVERNRLEETVGTLERVSPFAFNYDEWPEGAAKPQVGDRVYFARYAGILTEFDDGWCRIVKDKDIVAIVPAVPALRAAA